MHYTYYLAYFYIFIASPDRVHILILNYTQYLEVMSLFTSKTLGTQDS